MQRCCRAHACEEVFGPRVASSDLARYRRRGLDTLARRMLASVPRSALSPTSRVLEIGGGIGALQAEALLAGVGSGEVVELVGAYRPYAERLAVELGIAERSRFRVADLLEAANGQGHGADSDPGRGGPAVGEPAVGEPASGGLDPARPARLDPPPVEPADVVMMHRVVCCSPDGLELTEVASRLARRALVLSFPRFTLLSRAVAWAQDLLFRALGREYRIFVRPEAAIVERAEAHGLRVIARGHDLVWTFVALERA